MKFTLRSAFVLTLALISLSLLVAGCTPAQSNQAAESDSANRPGPLADTPPEGDRAHVEWVYDGDTIEVTLNGDIYKVRYIGVDTPEREEYFYEEAFDFNMDMVRDKTVILVKDVSDTDQYGRLLRYVYLPDGTFVNAELISNGMARLVTFPPDVANTDYFKSLQEEARNDGRGMWADMELAGPCDCDRNLYDCRDFDSQREAQTCFDYCMETTGEDVHHLDGGGDGRVCESLP
ncbi:MAG: thermonuclease family protein [Chloroflexota bacterium]